MAKKTRKKSTGATGKTSRRASASQRSARKTAMPAFPFTANFGTGGFEKLLALPTNTNTMESMMSKSKMNMDKMTQDAASYGRDQMEVFMKCSSIFAKRFEEIMRTSMSLAQDAAERQSQYMKDAMSSKTINEWAEAQNKIAQANFDDFMAGATKISEMSVKMMSEATEPLNEQMTKAMRQTSAMAA